MLLDRLLSNLDVHVDYFTLCTLSAGWRLRLPGPPGVMMHFVLQGQGVVRGPDGTGHRIGPYCLAVVPQGAKHQLETVGEIQHELGIDAPPQGEPVPRLVAGSLEDIDLIVACGLVRVRYGESLGLFDHLHEMLMVDLSDSPQVLAVFQDLLKEQSQPGPGREAMMGALMGQCLVYLFRRLYAGREPSLPWLTALNNPGLARAIDRVLDNPGANHTVESLANLAAMSRSSFAEHFASAFGRPPMSLVHHLRMQRASHLLQQGELSTNEVACRVGFSSRSHFSRCFKKHTGVSPAAYRRQ